MIHQKIVEIYVSLLDEGTPTIRGTKAIDLGNDLYRVLPTPFYDPEDEIWEFLPGSIVRCKKAKDHKGHEILLASEKIG